MTVQSDSGASMPHYAIAELKALLSDRAKLDLSPIELAEALWLAWQRSEGREPWQETAALPSLPEAMAGGQPTASPSQETGGREEAQATAASNADAAAAIVAEPPSPHESDKPAETALPINIPAAIALRNRRDIARSLRPLMRKVPSKFRQAIDEEATVLQIAEDNTWSPVVKPEPERWLELAIVVEVTSLLAVWHDPIAEFQHLMARHGAFRDVRVWQLQPDDQGKPQLWLQTAAGLKGKPRSPRELMDAGGRRLILLLSDCTSQAWRSGGIPTLLQQWSRQNPVTIAQLLPEDYWDRSALGLGYPVALRSRQPGALSRDWKVEGLSHRRRQRLRQGLKFPVVTIQPQSLGQWAKATAAVGEQPTTGIVLGGQALEAPPMHPTEPLTAKQLVRRFRGTASAQAQALADMMAVLPVNWSVIRLLQKNMGQGADSAQETGALPLAEIFLSGLLVPVATAAPTTPPGAAYDFVQGVRDVLLGAIPISEAKAVGDDIATQIFRQLPQSVQDRVDADIARRFGESLGYFQAFLIPDLDWGEAAATEIFPFARVTGQVLRRWGGDYAAMAERLESHGGGSGEQSSKQPVDEITALVVLDQHLEAIRGQIAEMFSEQEHDFQLNIHPREEAALGAIEEVLLDQDSEISVETFEQTLIERSHEYVSFELPVRINFSAEIRFFDFDVRHPEMEDTPTFGDIVPNQTVDAVAEVTLWFSEEDMNEVEPELVGLRVEQPILINPTPAEADSSTSTPPLRTFEFEVATIAVEEPPSQEPPSPQFASVRFEFELALIEVKKTGGILGFGQANKIIIHRRQRQTTGFTEDLGNGVTLDLMQIPAGSFLMGSPKNEPERSDNESPQHLVTVPSFLIGKYPITQAQYEAVIGTNPAHFKGNNRPVETVSWEDAIAFCTQLSQKTGRPYRLPSEAEWEYACRANPVARAGSLRAGDAIGNGTVTPFHFGETITTDLANYRGTDNKEYNRSGSYGGGPKGIYREETTPVGSFPANAFGLYDMHGNVWEWCQDHWHSNYKGAPTDGSVWIDPEVTSRLLRGGSWDNYPWVCRSACRYDLNPGFRNIYIGFRLVCSA